MDGPTKAFKARWVFPVDGPPIEDGAVTFRGSTITAVGRDPTADIVEDLGNVALLPGLVNAHTHLEFSDLDSPLGEQGMSLPDWIRLVIEFRASASRDISATVQQGLRECIAFGTTAVGEIVSSTVPLEAYAQTPLPLTLFHELIGLSESMGAEALASGVQRCTGSENLASCAVGLSPHAPYSVHRDVVAACAVDRNRPVAMHLAESREEIELLSSGTGPFVDLLKDLGAWNPTAIPQGTRPLDYLKLLAACDRSLVIHGNYLDDEEIQFLAANRSRMTVVYCPRTHAYFGHSPYPLAKMLAAGVRVAIGTDSRASNPDLNMLEEMRFVAKTHPDVSPSDILSMATRGAAEALGCKKSGTIVLGRHADLVAIPLHQNESRDPWESLLNPSSPIHAAWRSGTITTSPGHHQSPP